MPHSRREPQQRQNVDALNARSVVPALRLNPSKSTWRCSTTSTGHLFSIGTLSLIKTLWSTVLLNPPPLASTLARCRNVRGCQAPGSIYATISSCHILRILFAFQLRALNPCQGVKDVGYRHRWRISVEVIIGQLCVREDGRGKGSMRLPYVPNKHSDDRLWRTGTRSWNGWRFLSTWVSLLLTMMPIIRP
jgi:hypothetical protein